MWLGQDLIMKPRTIAIGDIHGCSAAFDAVLEAIRPGAEDCIVTLGDYINRGPDSRGVIERLIELKSRCHLFPLFGNHEQMLFDALAGRSPLQRFLGVGGDSTLDSYGAEQDLDAIPDDHYTFLRTCLDYYETDTHIFVHANYFPEIAMDEQHVGMLRWKVDEGQMSSTRTNRARQ